MESRGDSSIGERDSGTDSNKGNITFMESTEAESAVVLQNTNVYSDLAAKCNQDYALSIDARENTALDGSGFLLAGGMSNSRSLPEIRQLKPLLKIDNNFKKSSTFPMPFGREMIHMPMDEQTMASNTCLTMSLGLYKTNTPDMDIHGANGANNTNGHGVYNIPGIFMRPLELNPEERSHFNMHGYANPRQLLLKHHNMHQLSRPDGFEQPQPQVISRSEVPNASPHVPVRVARPPIEGRGRNQLLPRYWPRITDQELQQITARDSNSTITPLFEKMLSASDAGRIGRLVLPKACAEAYFPPISQPEGVSLKIQDVSGKDWVFQFRFWPNNNSRMYVLEGVTPCIQSMQLQAGDTVTFSRLDPEGKLVMGFRKAPSSLSPQETTGTPGGPSPFINSNGSIDNFPTIASLTGLLSHSVKNSEPRANGHLNISDTGYGWYNKAEKGGPKTKENSLFQSLLASDKKLRPPSSKNKSPINTDESMEFRITWEEAQDLLRSPPNVSPNIVTIEGFVFEEYEEPPVFGKRTIFTSKTLGPGEDQWAQCDDCGSWRKVPSNVFLPTRWVCAENVWDAQRNSCNTLQELDNEEIEYLVQHLKDTKKQEVEEPGKTSEALSGLEALANVATATATATATAEEDSTVPLSPATTTKHPRHRPGCSCIVCIQPPSGKGPKHKPSCTCNVCMTVKRRFKTLMMRRKKRQLEREAEHAARKKRLWTTEDSVGDVGNGGGKWKNEGYLLAEGIPGRQGNLGMILPDMLPMTPNLPSTANGYRFPSNVQLQSPYASTVVNFMDDFKGHFDLNGKPGRDEETHRSTFRMSMMRLLQNASHPLESYLKDQGLTSLIGTQQQLMHPLMSFTRNVPEQEAERHHNTMAYPTMMSSSERAQDEDRLYMTLGMPNFRTPAD